MNTANRVRSMIWAHNRTSTERRLKAVFLLLSALEKAKMRCRLSSKRIRHVGDQGDLKCLVGLVEGVGRTDHVIRVG